MPREIPEVSVLYDEEERLRQCELLNQSSIEVTVDCVTYHVPYDEIDTLSDSEIELIKAMNTRDEQAIELVEGTTKPLPFVSDYNKDLADKGCTFDWSGNVWTRAGRLRKIVHGGNGYLQLENVGIHRRLYAEFLARVNDPKYVLERQQWNFWNFYHVHHMTGKHDDLSDNCITNLRLIGLPLHQYYTSLIGRIRNEIRSKKRVGVLI